MEQIVEKIDGYRLGDGFVAANWVKKQVPDIKTIKRAEELLELCWKKQLIRRRHKSKKYVYARLATDEEWAKIRERETQAVEDERQDCAEKQRREFLRKVDARAKAAAKEEASLVKKCERYRKEYEAATEHEAECRTLPSIGRSWLPRLRSRGSRKSLEIWASSRSPRGVNSARKSLEGRGACRFRSVKRKSR